MVHADDGDWIVSWHPPLTPPDGTPHGAAGLCVTGDGAVVIVSADGQHWDLPQGRPEEGETWEETLRREMWEEACVAVGQARLLGFCRSACVAGPQTGRILVRSLWCAEVQLASWEPQFEIAHRRTVPAVEIIDHLTIPDSFARIVSRALREVAIA